MARVLDLFAGAGGWSAGFAQAGYTVTDAVEHDRTAAAAWQANHPTGRMHLADITAWHPDSITADVVVGSPPCPSFSTMTHIADMTAAGRAHLDRDRTLWAHFARIVEHVQPAAWAMENVGGFLTSPEWPAMLAAMPSWSITGAVVNAADFGAPQHRKRAIVIGARTGPATLPAPTHSRTGGITLFGPLRPWQAAGPAIADLPTDPTVPPRHVLDIMAHIAPGQDWRAVPLRLLPRRFTRITDGTRGVYGRKHPDQPARTVLTENGWAKPGYPWDPHTDRIASVAQRARLQTFPDAWEWPDTKTAAHRLIGNAVPPLLARRIAEHIAPLVST